ncbi:MAG: Gfo/Idh/MocA family oxidoreductase [Clostridia bacterium]|nr:Gfo/Idh/MocA family oxidoreductase [Clostridia bacterium]
MKKIKLGIIGYGNMGTGHISNIMNGKAPNVELVAVCDTDKSRLDAFSGRYPEIPVFDSAEAMYKSGLCDSVLLAGPHYDHPSLAIKAFEYGLHVLIEKPAGVYTKQVKEMNNAAAKSDKIFAIMYNQRTNPVYKQLKKMIERGDLGHIKRITWIITDWYRPQAYHDSSKWRSTWKDEGGGALINQNPHQLDLWQWLFGMPDRVFAKVSFGKYYDIEVEDDVMAYFEYDNGTTGEYITATGEAPGTNRLEVACDMGKIVIENNKMTFARNVISEREHNKTNTEPFGRPECWNCEIPADFSGGEQHMGVLKSFASAILDGGELVAKGEEGVYGLTVSNAIHLSGWTGRTVDVKNFPDDEFYELLQEKIKSSTYVKKERKVVVQDMKGTY